MSLLSFMRDALFPPSCAACRTILSSHTRFSALCNECFSHIAIRSGFICPECGRRCPAYARTCHRGMPYVLGAATDFKNDAMRALIHTLKYGGRTDAAKPIGETLASYALSLARELPFPLREAIIIPVPLHTKKERLRGYNQSRAIADAFVAALPENAPTVMNELLIRTRNTDSQTKQENDRARSENMKGAFALAMPHSLRGKTVILLDDVTTSGATLAEAARALRDAEPSRIFALTAAKA